VIRPLALLVLAATSFAQTNKPPLPSPAGADTTLGAGEDLATISLDQYRARLIEADEAVATCQRAIDPQNCKSDTVGPDVQVSLPAGPRAIRFNWLRSLLDEAAHYDSAKQSGDSRQSDASIALPTKVNPAAGPQTKASPATDPPRKLPIVAPPVTTEAADQTESLPRRLERARERLKQDLGRANQEVVKPEAAPGISSQRQALTVILAAREYRSATIGPTLRDRILEKVARWLNRAINKLVDVGSKSKWIGISAEVGFVIVLCVGLVWFLIRLDKQGRFGSALLNGAGGAGAPSERDWQLWLKDAREAAAQGAWREAIHFTYWASISRMESSGMWSADRARTPREYLALLSDENSQRSERKDRLIALTRSFERTWYGGRPAVEADFQRAEQLAAALGVKSDATSDGGGKTR